MASLSNEGPRYHVGQELTSVRTTRTERLNVEEVSSQTIEGRASIDRADG